MNTESLLRQAMQKIASASSNFQMSEIARLNRIAERVTAIQTSQQQLERELASLAAELNQPSQDGGAATLPTRSELPLYAQSARISPAASLLVGPISITIDWGSIGKPHPRQTICERMGSDTLRAFFETIHERFGLETLSRLVAIRANRAPLLSRQPQTDFLNPRKGVCYQHQQVGSTGWYVLTHSSTVEKLGIIRQVARALRFPPGAVTVQEVDLKQQMETLLN